MVSGFFMSAANIYEIMAEQVKNTKGKYRNTSSTEDIAGTAAPPGVSR